MTDTPTKTAEEWFDRLPEDIRKKAIKNIVHIDEDRIPEYVKYSSLKQALESAFVWIETKEGFSYWREIHKSL